MIALKKTISAGCGAEVNRSQTREMRLLGLVILAFSVVMGSVSATPAERSLKSRPNHTQKNDVSVFQRPGLWAHQNLVKRLVRLGQYDKAEKALRKIIGRFPQIPVNYYNLALVRARQKKIEGALDSLAKAIDKGFRDAAKIEGDPNLATLHDRPRFKKLIEIARNTANSERSKRPVSSVIVERGTAMVEEINTAWDPRHNILRSFFRFSPNASANTLVSAGKDPISSRLNEWYKKGLAAGNHGDLYDNRDKDHSNLSRRRFPQLTFVEYSELAQKAGVHYGLNTSMFFNAITFGNSSTAANGPFWRSQARLALTQPSIPGILYLQYLNNHLYVYPEHRDHDSKHGDVLPANTPYMIISQGSSGSDGPFLNAIAYILAAFRPNVKNYLRQKHLMMPTVQMIFRRGQKPVKSDQDYLSGKAHPSVFQATNIDLTKMIKLANGMRISDIPPMVRLTVVEESSGKNGVDFFAPGFSEKLFDTPSAIGRIVRSTAYEKRMIISAAQTAISSKQRLNYRWTVLRGDADRIRFKPLNEEGSVMEIIIPWHERRSIPERPELTSDRVDIGVFAHNGKHFSAPAFISLLYPGNQKRKYNRQKQIVRVDYHDKKYSKRYVDPLLFPVREWSDAYRYDKQGRLIGWQRVSTGLYRNEKNFTRHGAKVVEKDALGRPVAARVTHYIIKQMKGGLTKVSEQLLATKRTRQRLFYEYASDKDQLGKVGRKDQR